MHLNMLKKLFKYLLLIFLNEISFNKNVQHKLEENFNIINYFIQLYFIYFLHNTPILFLMIQYYVGILLNF